MNSEISNTDKDKKYALISAMMGSFLAPFLSSSVNVALPSIEFQMSAVTMSWITTAILLASAVTVVPFGKIADIYGRKKLYNIGMLVIAFSCIMAAFAFDPISLIFARTLQGIGSGMTFATGLAIVSTLYQPHERGKAIGWVISVVYIGLSLGPFLGGVITQNFGWRVLFLINLPFALIGWYYGYKIKQEWKVEQISGYDYLGTFIYVISILLLMFGFSKLNTLPGALTWGIGVLGFIVFGIYSHKNKNPLIDISLFWRNRLFTMSNIASLINYSTTFSVSFLLSLYLQITKGMTPAQAGSILVAQPIVMAAFTPFTGRLSDKFNPNILASIGMTISGLGLLSLSFITLETSVSFLVINLLVLGLGFSLFSSPNTTAIMGSVEKKELAVASSISSTMRLLGQMMSMGLTMLVIAFFVGDKESIKNHPDGLMNTIHYGYLMFTLLSVVGIFASLSRGKKS
jgi:MFS family permease